MAVLRRDVARNRDRILVAAAALRTAGEPLQLNAVARRAEVGVGTVYRHFASPEALAEGLVEHRFGELAESARAVAERFPADEALRRFLDEALRVYAGDPDFAAASVVGAPVRAETEAARAELMDAVRLLVDAAASRLEPGLTAADLLVLLCGLAYSVRLRPERAAAYLDALLDGVLR